MASRGLPLTTNFLLVIQISLFILNELGPWKKSQRARQFSLQRMAAKESWNALIINESINYNSLSPMGSVLVTAGLKLFRELDTEDALYRANYVKINYFFR